MKVSVALATCNGAAYLDEQLASLATQSRLPDELVVCDDASDDDSLKVVERFARRAPFAVRVYAGKERLGIIKNFERAVSLCEGDGIALADQDDVWMPDKLARITASLSASASLQLVFSNAGLVDKGLRPLGYDLWQSVGFSRRERRQVRAGKAFDVLLRHTLVSGCTLAFHSGFRDLLMPFPTGVGLLHDEWVALLMAAVAEVGIIEDELLLYRQHEQQAAGIAVPSGALTRYFFSRARKADANLYRSEVRRLRAVQERLQACRQTYACDAALAKLAQRIAHLETRGNMPRARLRRLPHVLKELLTLRYHACSSGWISALKDIWF